MHGLFPGTKCCRLAATLGHTEEPGAFGPKRNIRKEDGSLQYSCVGKPPGQGDIHALSMYAVWDEVDCPEGWRQGQWP